jgi:hypothetical protein
LPNVSCIFFSFSACILRSNFFSKALRRFKDEPPRRSISEDSVYEVQQVEYPSLVMYDLEGRTVRRLRQRLAGDLAQCARLVSRTWLMDTAIWFPGFLTFHPLLPRLDHK